MKKTIQTLNKSPENKKNKIGKNKQVRFKITTKKRKKGGKRHTDQFQTKKTVNTRSPVIKKKSIDEHQ